MKFEKEKKNNISLFVMGYIFGELILVLGIFLISYFVFHKTISPNFMSIIVILVFLILLIKPPYKGITLLNFINGFKEVGKNIAYFVNLILLSLLYLVVIGLTKLFYKKRLDDKAEWVDLNLGKKKLEDCYKQY